MLAHVVTVFVVIVIIFFTEFGLGLEVIGALMDLSAPVFRNAAIQRTQSSVAISTTGRGTVLFLSFIYWYMSTMS